VLDPVTVTAEGGTLETVTVTNPEGKQVAGEFDAARKSWRSTEHFGYGKQYAVAVKGTGGGGQPVEQSSTFNTVKPKNQTMPYLRASDTHLLKERSTYGVGQTVQVWFDERVPDKAAAQRLLEVNTSPETEGAWHWFGSQRVEWRPKEYWKPGTEVTVKASLYGKDLGQGLYGQADVSDSFKIGDSRIAIADNDSKQMKVFVNGQMVRQMPVSLGKGGYNKTANGETINYWTNGGPHVVLEKAPVTRMSSASYGVKDPKDPNFYDEQIKLTVKISASGEYLHLADWNVSAHGRTNTSHGCINIGPANAQWIYDNFVPGDVVDVKNSPVKLAPTNGIGAWTLSWADWTKGSAL
jgi:lipoprotein-anchoring transpeptidase ErfK/SrfK